MMMDETNNKLPPIIRDIFHIDDVPRIYTLTFEEMVSVTVGDDELVVNYPMELFTGAYPPIPDILRGLAIAVAYQWQQGERSTPPAHP